jgi:hypothetical protein
MPTLLQRLKLRHKLAALSVIGVTMCLLPLWQVLRYQALEIDAARRAEGGPDPALLAVTLQRGLLGHRDITAQVLGGLGELEMERRQRQATVTLGMAEVGQAVQRRGPLPAMDEVQSMRSDWVDLVRRVVLRELSADESNAAHRLLVEQTLQIIDLVADSSTLLTDSDPAIARLTHALAGPLPRFTVALQTPRGDVAPGKGSAALRATATEVDRALLTLPAVSDVVQAKALGEATARARRAVAAYLQQVRDGTRHGSGATPPTAAETAAEIRSLELAQQAHMAVVAVLQDQLQGRLQARLGSLQQQRQILLLAMAALALLALALMASLARALVQIDAVVRDGLAELGVDSADGQSALREVTRWLWQRLGRPEAAMAKAERKPEHREP